jgi:hypothetical protein
VPFARVITTVDRRQDEQQASGTMHSLTVRSDGTDVVIDCRPDERIRPRDAVAFEATAQACETVGWEYSRCGAIDEPLANRVLQQPP